MSPQIKAIPFILAGVLLNALAQIPLKKGLVAAGGFNLEHGVLSLLKIFIQPWILVGLTCYALSLVVWLVALSKVDVAFAYPFLALGFLANALLARCLLGETIPALRWAALGLIVAGVALQAFTGDHGDKRTHLSASPESTQGSPKP
jgi:multidrug transporter EmrE-like cation transporter